MSATSRLGGKADRAKFIRPTLCRMAAGWRSGRTPAEPYPPADRGMVAAGPATSQAAARAPPAARPASSGPQWPRSPGDETDKQKRGPIIATDLTEGYTNGYQLTGWF